MFSDFRTTATLGNPINRGREGSTLSGASKSSSQPFRSGAALCLLAVIALSPWFFGGAVESHQAGFAVGIAIALGLSAISFALASTTEKIIGIPMPLLLGALALLLGAFQCVELPDSLLRFFSPAGFQLWRDLGQGGRTISLYPGSTTTELARGLLMLGTFMVGLEIYRSRRWVSRTLHLLVAVGVALVLFSWIQGLTWNGRIFWFVPFNQTGQPFGSFVNRNHAGAYLNLCFSAALALSLDASKICASGPSSSNSSRHLLKGERRGMQDRGYLLWGICGLLVAGVFSTQSRGAILSLLLAGTVTAIRLVRVRRGAGIGPISAMFAGLVIVGFGLTWWIGKGDDLQGRMTGIVEDWPAATTGRIDHWKDSIHMVPEFWRVGSGLGTYRYLYRLYESAYHPAWYYHAENCYLEILVEAGLPGLLLFAGIWGTALWTTRNRPADPNPSSMALRIAGSNALVSQAVHAALDFNLYMPANAIVLSLLMSLLWMHDRHTEVPAGSARTGIPGIGIKTRMLGAFAGLVVIGLLIVAARHLQQTGKLFAVIHRLDELGSNSEPALDDVRTALGQIARTTDMLGSAEGFDRMARLCEFQYRLEAKQQLQVRLGSTAAAESLWSLTDLFVLHRRLYEQGENLPRTLAILRADPSIQTHLKRAWEYYHQALQSCCLRGTSHLGRGRMAVLLDSSLEEVRELNNAVRVAPYDIDLLFSVARLHLQSGRQKEGLDVLRRSLRGSPKYGPDVERLMEGIMPRQEMWGAVFEGLPERAVEAGRRLNTSGTADSDRRCLADAIKESLEGDAIPEPQRTYYRAVAAEFRGSLDEAIQGYHAAVALAPQNDVWHFEYAQALMQAGDIGKGLAQARLCRELKPRVVRYQELERALTTRLRSQLKTPSSP